MINKGNFIIYMLHSTYQQQHSWLSCVSSHAPHSLPFLRSRNLAAIAMLMICFTHSGYPDINSNYKDNVTSCQFSIIFTSFFNFISTDYMPFLNCQLTLATAFHLNIFFRCTYRTKHPFTPVALVPGTMPWPIASQLLVVRFVYRISLHRMMSMSNRLYSMHS